MNWKKNMVEWLNNIPGIGQYQNETHCHDVWYATTTYKWRCFNLKTDEALYGEAETYEEACEASLSAADLLKE